jgi:uncharacterized protein YbdZ (MbtH family)
MRVALWDRPIEITIDAGSHFVCVSNSRDALRYLLTEWTEKGGVSFSAARAACLASIRGDVASSVAMDAFEQAARDANMLR